jgi:hypothetical protein
MVKKLLPDCEIFRQVWLHKVHCLCQRLEYQAPKDSTKIDSSKLYIDLDYLQRIPEKHQIEMRLAGDSFKDMRYLIQRNSWFLIFEESELEIRN